MIEATLHHIAIIVSSEESLNFYKQLGFVEESREVRPEKHDSIVFLRGFGTTLEMFVDVTHPARLTNPETYGLRHIAFEVKDVIKAREELAHLNPTEIGSKYNNFFITDPDGIKVEFKQA